MHTHLYYIYLDGIGKFLKGKDLIKFKSHKIILSDDDTNMILQKLINDVIDGQSHQRIILIVDRSRDNGCDHDQGEDMIHLYQLPEYNKIKTDYNGSEQHLSFMTRKRLFPDWKHVDEGINLEMYKGAGDDIGDRGFAFSFHIHDKDRIKCEQWIKSQKLPFLPHHMIDLWPLYFARGYKEIDSDRFDKEKIYTNWKLQTRDHSLMTWIKLITPNYYENLTKDHLEMQTLYWSLIPIW